MRYPLPNKPALFSAVIQTGHVYLPNRPVRWAMVYAVTNIGYTLQVPA
jgi:hypothetical protein